MEDERRRTLERFLAVLTLLMVMAMAGRYTVSPDTWWHLSAGKWIWVHHALPNVDPFSYTRLGEAWHYPGWPVELLMYGLYRLGGLGALNVAVALTVVAAWGLVWLTLRELDVSVHPLIKAAAVTLGAATSAIYWSARPHLLSFLLSALFLWLLARARRRGARLLVWLPFLMVLWANGHGAFIMGLVWWGVYWAAALLRWGVRRWREGPQAAAAAWRWLLALTAVGAALVLAVLVNPYGLEMYGYPFKTLGIHALRKISEWQAPDFHKSSLLPMLTLLVALLWVVGASARRITLEHAFLVGGMLMMALTAVRNVALFAVVAVPMLARHAEFLRRDVTAWLPAREERPPAPIHPRLNLALIGLAALVAFGKVGVMALPQVNASATAKNFPVGAAAFLETERPQGRLFNDYGWGAYLLWAAPDYPVFIDGRADLYGDEIIGQWLRVAEVKPGWEAVLDYWDVRLVLMPPDTPLGRLLLIRGWRVLYRDHISVLYGR